MNDAIQTFQNGCCEAFRFLLTDFGFQKVSELHPEHSNPFQVRFRKEPIEILVLGESYGTRAAISYITEEGTEVSTQMLETTWETLKKKKVRKKKPNMTQMEQVIAAANRIEERDVEILNGNLIQLSEVATRWQGIRAKMGWK